MKENQEIKYPRGIGKIDLKEYPPKEKKQITKCIIDNKVNIPKTNAIIKEEDYYEKDK